MTPKQKMINEMRTKISNNFVEGMSQWTTEQVRLTYRRALLNELPQRATL